MSDRFHSLSKPLMGFSIGVAMLAASSIAPAWSREKVVYSFTGGTSEGAYPFGPLIMAKDKLIGTTMAGGNGTGSQCAPNDGCGTVFRLTRSGGLSVLYNFAGRCDGALPEGGLLRDSAGNYYGTTIEGGDCSGQGAGTVFKIAPNGTETVLYAFQGTTDGNWPQGNLVSDKKGNLYGTTSFGGNMADCGGNGCGTVFEVSPNGTETVLYRFQGGSDGGEPLAGVIRDKKGDLYGTTELGGNMTACEIGCGVVFKLTPRGVQSVVYAFQGGSDGFYPEAGLIEDKAGNLYGTTLAGGGSNLGTVFKIAPHGTEAVLYAFHGVDDGNSPVAGLIEDKAGNLYGTTSAGGAGDFGTVFELARDGTETVLNSFGGTSGSGPNGSVLAGENGSLFGATTYGGNDNLGVVFAVEK